MFSEVVKVFPDFEHLDGDQQLYVIFGGSRGDMTRLQRLKLLKITCTSVAYMYKIRTTNSVN